MRNPDTTERPKPLGIALSGIDYMSTGRCLALRLPTLANTTSGGRADLLIQSSRL